jgi:hypothetical protein
VLLGGRCCRSYEGRAASRKSSAIVPSDHRCKWLYVHGFVDPSPFGAADLVSVTRFACRAAALSGRQAEETKSSIEAALSNAAGRSGTP